MTARARALMLQGTGSHVGKSVLVAALCRFFREAGRDVAPFKAQNMALNAYVTRDGGEIGWAQAMQAEAAGLEPSVDMNPVLLKPEPGGAQVIVRGRVRATLAPRAYYRRRAELWEAVAGAYRRLAAAHELIVIEGAGSPAEPNLQASDIVNMAVARLARAPVLLVGDIDRGGVFASFVGSLALLPRADRRRVRGFVVNKFRGDRALLQPALDFLEARTRRPVLGVVPYVPDLHLPEEDSVALDEGEPGAPTPRWGGAGGDHRRGGTARGPQARGVPAGSMLGLPPCVAIIRLPYIANFTDFAPLAADPAVAVRYVTRPDELSGAALVVLPGSKDTLADLRWLRETGLADALAAHGARGGRLAGICGGFQMLGRAVEDPHGLESGGGAPGLGCLPVTTVLERGKVTRRVRARLAAGGEPFEAYELHLGRTRAGAGSRPLALVEDAGVWRPEGAVSRDGRVWGSYLHGLFDAPHVRRALLADLAAAAGAGPASPDYRALREREYTRLAALIREHLDAKTLGALVEAT